MSTFLSGLYVSEIPVYFLFLNVFMFKKKVCGVKSCHFHKTAMTGISCSLRNHAKRGNFQMNCSDRESRKANDWYMYISQAESVNCIVVFFQDT